MSAIESTPDASALTCEACGENPASVFTAEYALCKPCRQHELTHPPVNEAFARHVRMLGGAGKARFARSPQDPTDAEQGYADWVDSYTDVDMNESETVR